MSDPNPEELNAMTPQERKALLSGDFGRRFHVDAAEHVTWIFWTRDTQGPNDILGQGSAFILVCDGGPILVTAAHVFDQYVKDLEEHGALYLQVANTRVRDLASHLIAHGDPQRGPDIATFRLPPGAVERIGKKPIIGPSGPWPAPPRQSDIVLFGGFPGEARVVEQSAEINFGFHSGMTPVTSLTDREITCRFSREFWVDSHGDLGLPRPGYDLGGVSGGPLLVPDYRSGSWRWRLAGVVSEAPAGRPEKDVLFESVVASRAEFILPDGRLAVSL